MVVDWAKRRLRVNRWFRNTVSLKSTGQLLSATLHYVKILKNRYIFSSDHELLKGI